MNKVTRFITEAATQGRDVTILPESSPGLTEAAYEDRISKR